MTPQDKGLYFGPKNLEQKFLSYLHFIDKLAELARETLTTHDFCNVSC